MRGLAAEHSHRLMLSVSFAVDVLEWFALPMLVPLMRPCSDFPVCLPLPCTGPCRHLL